MQRKTAAQTSGGAAAKDDDEGYYQRPLDDEKDDDDGKTARLTLMEEVLLLGLKDREVFVLFFILFVINALCKCICTRDVIIGGLHLVTYDM